MVLVKRTKDELLDILVELTRADRDILSRCDARVELSPQPQELAAATHQAIAGATDFDERGVNHSVHYDYKACGEARRIWVA